MVTTVTDTDLADFCDECGWAASTLKRAVNTLHRWEVWLAARDVAVPAATHKELRAYLGERAAGTTGIVHASTGEPLGPLGPAALHKEWQIIGEVYAYFARPIPKSKDDRYGAGMLEHNPMARVAEPEIPETLTARIATPDIAHTLETHFARKAAKREEGGQRDRAVRNVAMVSLMMRSGLRASDVVGLDLHHLVRDGGELVAVVVGGDDGMRTKNRRQRLAPICDETPALLGKYLRLRGSEPGPLFLGREAHTADPDRRLQSKAVQDVIRRAAVACGVTVSAHDLRRGWAVTSARRGVDRGWIKATAGWGNDEMLDRYLGKEKGRVAVEAFRTAIGDTRRLRAV